MNNTTYNVVLIGAKSTGKTVYLTALYLLPFLRVTDKDTLNYLKPLKQQFENKNIAATNAGYQELFFEYNHNDFNLRFQIDDYDGKFAEQFSSDENKELKKKLELNVQRAEGMLFFLPYEKHLDINKLNNIREEIDLFIEKVKKLYPNKKQLPIPAVIAITKWDDSEYFKSSNELTKAKEYIENNEILKNIKEKIETFFSNTEIIPISSYEKYNLEKPLEFCFSHTFESWKKRIEELQNDKYKLLCFLSNIIDDIKFYKDGKYFKLYETIEKEIFNELYDKFKNTQNINEFNEINNNYKIKNRYLIDCLSDTNKKNITEIQNNLLALQKKEKIKKIAIAGGIVVLLAIGGYIYNKSKNKDILYSEITIAYKNNNLNKTLKLIKQYKTKFGKDSSHYKDVAKIENEVFSKCQSDINSKQNQLDSITSISKKIKLANDIKEEANMCNISVELNNFKKLKDDYDTMIELINQISVDNINEVMASQILTLYTKLKNYDEIKDIEELLNKKIETISEILFKSNDESTIDSITKLQIFMTQLNINNPELVKKLNQKYNQLKEIFAYTSFKDELSNLEYPEAIDYINTNYKSEFESNINEIKQILQQKFNQYVNNILSFMPNAIQTETDLDSLSQKLDIIDNLLSKEIEVINFTPYLDIDTQTKYDEAKELYDKYSGGANITYIAFSADSKNNEALGFECGSEDEIILNIDGKKYSYEDSNNCSGTTISWNINDYYNNSYYSVKATEVDTIDDDDYSSSFRLTKDDIINLINGGEVDKNIGSGYHVIFRGE